MKKTIFIFQIMSFMFWWFIGAIFGFEDGGILFALIISTINYFIVQMLAIAFYTSARD